MTQTLSPPNITNQTDKVIAWVGALNMLGGVIIGGILNATIGEKYGGVPLMFILLMFLVTAVLFIVLYARYHRHPIVKRRRHLLELKAQQQSELNQVISHITTLKSNLSHLVESRDNEIAKQLQALQTVHVINALHSTQIADANIAGIGPKFKEKLAQAGILVALQVDKVRLTNIPGFGEVKVNALLTWQYQVTQLATATQPRQLNPAEESRIRQNYELRSQEITNAINATDNLRQKQKLVLEESVAHLGQFQACTFLKFLTDSLAPRTYKLMGAVVAIAIGVMMFCNMCLAFSSMSAVIKSNIPTATATSTVTMTPTSTKTNLPTQTPTCTQTPTITLTPAVTNTFIPRASWTNTPYVRSNPITTPTNRPVWGSGGGVCNCGIDYDCGNFSSHQAAQSCFESCGGSTNNNWSGLDRDHDGAACESLP